MSTEPEKQIAAAVDGAELVRDPLDGLVDRAAADPGAPFAPEVLVGLAGLKRDDRTAFETLRAKLKERTKCRVTALDNAIADVSGEVRGRGPTHAGCGS
jgi:hypothetical protein